MDEVNPRTRTRIRLHDVSPLTWDACAEWIEFCRVLGLPPIELLVVPRHEGSPTDRGAGLPRDFVRRLKELAQQGHALWVHGWTHRAEEGHEAEFSGLDAVHAADRARRALLDWQEAGLPPPAGFCPPAWSLPRSALPRILQLGFPRIDLRWGDVTPEGLTLAPAISSWGGNHLLARLWDRTLPWQSRALELSFLPRRISLHPQDLDTPALLSFQKILHALS